MTSPRPPVYVATSLSDHDIARLEGVCEVTVRGMTGRPSRSELLEGLGTSKGLLCVNNAPLDSAFFDAVPPALRVISQIGVGFDNVDLAAATRAGILICNTPDVLTRAVADLTLGLIVYLARNLGPFSAFAKSSWGSGPYPAAGTDVHGKTLGIIGMGRIGRAVAKRAQAFDMRVLFHDVFNKPPPEAVFAEYRSKADLLREADFVSLHVDLNQGTRGFVSEPELALMKQSAYLINTSRGPVVDQPALTRALTKGRIAGAALDVLAQEPPDPADPILKLDNAFILPHIGTATIETRQAMVDLAIDNLISGVHGAVPPPVVNRDVIERWIAAE